MTRRGNEIKAGPLYGELAPRRVRVDTGAGTSQRVLACQRDSRLAIINPRHVGGDLNAPNVCLRSSRGALAAIGGSPKNRHDSCARGLKPSESNKLEVR